MSDGDRNPSWTIAAYVVGAGAIGAFDAARLKSAGIAAAAVPMFALTGLLAGLLVIGAERLARDRSWWLSALILAAPALLVFVPVAATLFDGAYAQTLAIAKVAPFVLPLALWLGSAAAIAIGRRVLRATDLTTRAIVILALASVIGAIVWAERHILKTGYPSAHIGATLAISVLAGVLVRITHRRQWPRPVALGIGIAVSLIVLASAVAAAVTGLHDTNDRRVLAQFGDQTRDLVGLWRKLGDFDRDGSSRILGGGDCNDSDKTRYPGAVDVPADGIDQDCDGVDATPVVVEPTPPPQDTASWHERPEVKAILERTKGMNVLVISIDALRADMLAPDAPDRADFPTLTKLLGESVWFTRAFAPASGTDISMATLLTGRFNPFQAVSTTLPEALKSAGYFTSAAIPAEVLRYAGETILKRGVDALTSIKTDSAKQDIGDHVSAPATTEAGVAALAKTGTKQFTWVHYFDVHEHHQIKVTDEMLAAVKPGPSEKFHVYRALLRAIDDEVGKIFKAPGFDAEKTIVVFFSDHGESLGEDPRLLVTHGKVTYAPLVRIPIALRIPGVAPAQRTDLASLVDIAPTLLELLGIAPPMTLDGTSLVPALLDAPAALRPTNRALALHEQDQWSVVEWPYQLLVRPADDLVELYNLETDPAQKQDLSTKEPEVVTRLKTRFASFPNFVVDRTPAGRSAREQLARQRPSPEKR
jgi:arylsulfatase A-like enzyme